MTDLQDDRTELRDPDVRDPVARPIGPVEADRARRRLLLRLGAATRGHVVARGLRRRRDRGPRPDGPARRRTLAAATSAGLVAPVLALDGLPEALADPSGPQWDTIGAGGVVAAGVSARDTGEVTIAPATDRGGPSDSLLRAATPWVAAAGVATDGAADVGQIMEAADRLGVQLDVRSDPSAVSMLRDAVLQRARPTTQALGLTSAGAAVTTDALLAAADALGVPRPAAVTPALLDAVVTAGREVVTARLDTTVTPYAEALGLDIGDRPDPSDTAAVAAELGIEPPDVPTGPAAERLHHAWLQTLQPLFAQLGIDPGSVVNPADVRALGRALGADLDSGVGPAQLSVLVGELERRTTTPPAYGDVGGVTLHLPSHDVLAAGWHQSSSAVAAPADDLGAAEVTTLPSRGRGTHAQTAIDVAVPVDTQVVSPVSGRVEEASPYLLYGEHADTRITIRPDDRPDLLVTVLHVTGAQVAPGDHVTAGDPLASSATLFPFDSQIDELAGRNPHVHIEVRPL